MFYENGSAGRSRPFLGWFVTRAHGFYPEKPKPPALFFSPENTMRTLLPSTAASCQNPTKPTAAAYNRRKFPSHPRTCFLAFFAFFAVNFICTAQIQQAWVARYNNGISNGTNQAVKMALDTNGNIYPARPAATKTVPRECLAQRRRGAEKDQPETPCIVFSAPLRLCAKKSLRECVILTDCSITGFSQNTNGQLGYATIKYAPNGNQLWVARYDSTNYPSAQPTGLALDHQSSTVVTGSAVTVKYDSNGNVLWTLSYSGAGIAVDSSNNICITGVASNYTTMKFTPTGTNLWAQTFTSRVRAARRQST
jgi:hypothetical protein